MSAARRPTARIVDTVDRALAVLEALASGGELGTNELARRVGAHPSSVSRVLATLEQRGFVAYVPASGRYRLGLRLVDLGNAVLSRGDLRDLARPHLSMLAEISSETATLSVPGERDAVTVDFVQSLQSVVSVARLGRPSVGHATATGKVMLAFTTTADATAGAELERFTDRTIVDHARLRRELARVRAQGFAEAYEEREAGLSAIAAPVHGNGGELVAILGLQGPSTRFRGEASRKAVEPLREHAFALGAELGFGAGHAGRPRRSGASSCDY